MGYPTKVQLIQRKQSQQWYINFPAAIAQGMDFAKGEEVQWTIADRGHLILSRNQVPPNPIDLKKLFPPRRSRSPDPAICRCLLHTAVREGSKGGASLIPIGFQHAALPAEPHPQAPQEQHEAYQIERAKRNINLVGRERLACLRRQMDEGGSASRRLLATVDGRFTNSTVLRHIPERTVLIGRVRKDSAFYHPPERQPERGRKRKYGQRCPTPEALLKDPRVPRQPVRAHAGGHTFEFKVKTLVPVYSPMDNR